jgi:thiol-disulfide isomerase/thioredoxin
MEEFYHMKKTILFLLLKMAFGASTLLVSTPLYASACPADTAAPATTDFSIPLILNAPVRSIQLKDLKGKIVLLDFWGTFCGACIEAMPHLQRLQDSFPGQLQIITLSEETPTRIAQFLKVKPSNLWFGIDSNGAIRTRFPYQIIPHDILIGPEGQLIAATNPEVITSLVIDSLLQHLAVHLPVKEDMISNPEDLIHQVFGAADTVQSRFLIQGEIKGAGSMSSTWLIDSVFKGRRITCINLNLGLLYMLAHGGYSFSRTIDSTGTGTQVRYSLDLIVPHSQDLLPTLLTQLSGHFDVQARIVPMEKDVYVLRIIDQDKFGAIPRNQDGQKTYSVMHGEVNQKNMTMKDMAQVLEDYGVGKPTLDETHNLERLDIRFTWRPEDPASLTESLQVMGLSLTKERRIIPVLVLYKGQMGYL